MFIIAQVCGESSLVYVIRVYPYLVVARSKVKFGKNDSSLEFIKQVLNLRNKEFILDCQIIQTPKIYAQSPGFIFLPDQDGRRGKGTFTWPDFSIFEHLLDQLFHRIF
jgi:hypothetical protein